MEEPQEEETEINYLVVWKINIYGKNPTDTARKAREIQLDKESIATVFEISEADKPHLITFIDLDMQNRKEKYDEA